MCKTKPLGADEFFKLGNQMEMEEYDSKGALKGAGSIEAVPLIMSTEGGRNVGESQVPEGAVYFYGLGSPVVPHV